MTEASPEPSSGEASPFGRYLLHELIARGGMGEVFRAVAIGAGGFEKPVVVKRILPSLGGVAAMSKMFIEEARLMSRLVHPNIVQVIDFGQGNSDDYFLVMELVDGVDLRVFGKAFWKKKEGVPVGLAAYIGTQILRGLGHAHTKAYRDGRTLVHRDVSPGNVLLSRVGEVKVADFGVAHVAQPDAEGPKTTAGKLGYMAPEQVFGDTVDGRADVFSVGVVLHRLLTGGPAFVGDDEAMQQASAALGRIRDVLELRPEVGEDLAAVIEQALAPEPEQRFASARAMSKAIEAACRNSDIELANADDLADCVERIADARARRPKKVVELSDDVQRQLTRTGAFTMKVSAVTNVTDVTSYSTLIERSPNLVAEEAAPASEVSERFETPPPSVPLERSRTGIVIGAIAAIGIGGVVAWKVQPARTPTAPSSTRAVAPSQTAPEPPPSSPPPAPSEPPLRASVEAPAPQPSTSMRRPPVRSATPTPTSSPPAPTTAASTCMGKVLLSSRGSWWVSGGPSGRVQSPGMYTWRCGSYGLTGTSRVDGTVASRSVTVRDGATASARFE